MYVKELNGKKIKDEEARTGISDVLKILDGMRRKIIVMTGTIENDNEETWKQHRHLHGVVEVKTGTPNYIRLRFSKDTLNRTIDVNCDNGFAGSFDVFRMSAYNFDRTSLYSTEETTKVLRAVIVDNTSYTSIQDIMIEGLEFQKLIINHEVVDSAGVAISYVSNIITPSGFTVIETEVDNETHPLYTGFLTREGDSTKYINTMPHGGNTAIMRVSSDTALFFTETVTITGNTAVREVKWRD